MPWIMAAVALAPSVIGMFGGGNKAQKRSATDEIPGLETALSQTLKSKWASYNYANAAVDPSSEWNKQLTGMYKDQLFPEVYRGAKESQRLQQRLSARGIPQSFVYNPERRDEVFMKGLMDAYRNAGFQAQNAASTALANASKNVLGAGSDLNNIFGILGKYGQAEADRKQKEQEQNSNFLSQIFSIGGGLLGGGGGSGLAGSIAGSGYGNVGGLSAGSGGLYW